MEVAASQSQSLRWKVALGSMVCACALVLVCGWQSSQDESSHSVELNAIIGIDQLDPSAKSLSKSMDQYNVMRKLAKMNLHGTGHIDPTKINALKSLKGSAIEHLQRIHQNNDQRLQRYDLDKTAVEEKRRQVSERLKAKEKKDQQALNQHDRKLAAGIVQKNKALLEQIKKSDSRVSKMVSNALDAAHAGGAFP